MHLANRCKVALKRFRFKDLTKEQFIALILLSALKSPTEKPLRSRILQKLNQDEHQVCSDDVITDCMDFLTTKVDCHVFTSDNVYLNTMQKRRQRRKHPPLQQPKGSQPTTQKDAPSSCFRCGDLHWCKDCPHLRHMYNKCNRTGHLERQCNPIHKRHRQPKHNKVGLTQIGAVRQALTSNSLMMMEIVANGFPVKFYLDPGAEVNITSKETFDFISAPALRKWRGGTDVQWPNCNVPRERAFRVQTSRPPDRR
jgi:hypothetical protein